MVETAAVSTLHRRATVLAWLTIGWNAVEGLVAVAAGVAANSLALVGFGLDSGIEVFAGGVVLWNLRGGSEERERRALRLIAVSFFLLAGYVVVDAARDLTSGAEPGESAVGIGLAIASLTLMPLLARAKHRVGHELGSPVIMADAAQTRLCAYLSAILLAGLGLNALLGWWWSDAIAALGIAALAVAEGREAWKGELCCEADR